MQANCCFRSVASVGLCALLAGGVVRAAEPSLLPEFSVRRWAVEDGLPEAEITAVCQGADGYLWCTTPRTVTRFDGVRFVTAAWPAGLATNVTASLPASVAWPEFLQGDSPTVVLTNVAGAVWVGTARGLYRYQAGQWQSLTARDGVVYPVDVRCLAVDREGNLWAGTSGGLIRLRRSLVQVFRTGLPWGSEVVTALLAESPTNLFAAVAGGGLVAGPPEKLELQHVAGLPEAVTISALLRTRDGTLWVGTQGAGLWRCRSGQRAELFPGPNGICVLLEDRRGRLWVGAWDGLWWWDGTRPLTPVPGTPRNTAEEICEDSTSQIWVGYQSAGLLRFAANGQSQLFPCGSVRALLADATGDLWIGTARGLEWWRGARREKFTTINGLADNAILQILEDHDGYLWLGTRRGLMRIKKSEFAAVAAGRKLLLRARVFGSEAGMASEQCTGDLGTAAAQTADGRLWFPTMEGIAMVDPRAVPILPSRPPVYIESVQVNNQTLLLQNNTTVRLPLGARDLAFQFTAPIFTVPELARFRYQLVGYDLKLSWSIAERTVRYPRLPPGQYQFLVQARDRDGEFCEPATASVIVPAFFWETPWFQWGMVVAAIAVAGLSMRKYYQRRTARQLQDQERRHTVERERARIARDIHDDIGAGLTEMALLSDLAQTESGGDHLDRIFRRSRELAQSLDEIVWAINPRNDTLEGLLSYLAEFAQEFLTAAGIACRLDLPRDPPTWVLRPNIRHHLCLAVKEVLNNAVKHAAATEVQLRVEVLRQELFITITDNGIGFTGAVPAGHDGLKNLKSRLLEIAGTVQLTSSPGSGTRIVLAVNLPTI